MNQLKRRDNMKQLKFLKLVSCEGKPVWYKGFCYDVIEEGVNSQGRKIYKLFCEDLSLRGIDAALAGDFFEVINKEEITKVETVKTEEVVVETKSEDNSENKTEEVESTVKKTTSKKKKSSSK